MKSAALQKTPMITINREKGYLILSRCAYLHRDGKWDDKANREMGDGDIVIPLPPHMASTEWDHTGRSDGQNAVTIVEEIRRRLLAPQPTCHLERENAELTKQLHRFRESEEMIRRFGANYVPPTVEERRAEVEELARYVRENAELRAENERLRRNAEASREAFGHI